MTQDADIKLAAILDAYTVRDADPALLDRVVARATTPRLMAGLPLAAFFFDARVRRVAMVAGLALAGYWLGSLSVVAGGTAYHAAASVNIDHVFLGASSLNEVLL